MKKILVPSDLTPIAERGLKLAVEIAKRCNAQISLVNFTPHALGPTFTAMGDIAAYADDEANRFLVHFLHDTQKKLESYAALYEKEGVIIRPTIVDDDFKQGIDAYVQEQEIDLIVMGTSGEESGAEIFTGNHTQQVINVSTCPVVSVREGFKIEYLNHIVVAVEVIHDNQVASGLKILRDVAMCFDAHVHLVHVQQHVTHSTVILHEYFIKMAQAAELPKYSVTILEADDEAERVMTYARDVHAGLIAVLKNSRNGFFNIFSHHHFSDRLVKEVGRPVLTVNLQKAKAI